MARPRPSALDVPPRPAPPEGLGVPVDRSIRLEQHPTVVKVRAEGRANGYRTEPLDTDWLRQLCLDAGAEDVGFASLEDPALADERD